MKQKLPGGGGEQKELKEKVRANDGGDDSNHGGERVTNINTRSNL